MMYESFIRPWLFALEPETSHDITLKLLKWFYFLGAFRSQKKHVSVTSVTCFGLHFSNPIGLAAGLDKDAECLPAWYALGFGFIEVGTITPKPQMGNPKPRLFRLPKDGALINRMGFNGKGVDYLIHNLQKYSISCPIGVNIGKNKETSLELAHEDYVHCFEKVAPFSDYVTVNLSSPNTPGLRSLQQGELLKSIIQPLKNAQNTYASQSGKKVPIVVKISPDLALEEIKHIVDDLIALEVEGIIATNTTVNHDQYSKEVGGLSGKPLFEPSTTVIKCIYQHAGEKLPIIGVGGIMNKAHAKEKMLAGAKLIQLYTGFIYRGPTLIQEILG